MFKIKVSPEEKNKSVVTVSRSEINRFRITHFFSNFNNTIKLYQKVYFLMTAANFSPFRVISIFNIMQPGGVQRKIPMFFR